MHKLIILFYEPPDLDAFERRWSEEFVPRAERMPGLRRVAVSRVLGGLDEKAPDLHLIHELYFDDRETLESAMASEAGQEAGAILVAIAGERAQVLFAEHQEDIPRPSNREQD